MDGGKCAKPESSFRPTTLKTWTASLFCSSDSATSPLASAVALTV